MKYNIEGGIDFYEELYKSLDVNEDTNKTEEDKNLCLITYKPLCDKFVELTCGHKFNYIPIYLDIKNHKQKYNGMEGSATRLNVNEIRCPYCRKRHQNVLPYYEELNLDKITGVNWFDTKIHNTNTCYKKCEYLAPNPWFDPSGSHIIETSDYNNGNCKFLKCYVLGSKINYNNGVLGGENNGDEKYYCWTHKKNVIKQYKKAIADKAKEEAKNAKILAKEEAKNAKTSAKLINKNVVLCPLNITDISNNVTIEQGCIEIIKSGANKGNNCGCKIYQDNMCKRHHTIKNKVTVISLI